MEIDNTMDQYEKQLYSLFESYDSGSNGTLRREALEELCNTLQLENRGLQLVNLLYGDANKSNAVTFSEFRDGLLTVLGNENYDTSTRKTDRNDIHSGEDSSGREVSPKYIFGSKKYGRRSRPSRSSESTEFNDTRQETDSSSLETVEPNNVSILGQDQICNKKKKLNKIKRSISFTGNKNSECDRDFLDFVTPKSTKQLSISKTELMVFPSNSVPSFPCSREENSQSSSTLDFNSNTHVNFSHSTPSFEDFKKAIKILSHSSETISNSKMCAFQPTHPQEESVSLENIVELLESAGVAQPQQLLCDLGISNNHIVIADVIFTLEEEIKLLLNNLQGNLNTHSVVILFQAALCLYQCETKSLKLTLNHTVAERDKLRSDVADANQRAIILAQEVDENYTKMENTAVSDIKQMELKHSETVKHLSEQVILEKEQNTSVICNLEKTLSDMEHEESKLKSQVSILGEENLRLEKELQCCQEQLYELSEIKKQLSREVKKLSKQRHINRDIESERIDVLSLENQITKLQNENIYLKDKNDELCAELESVKAYQSPDQLKISTATSSGDSPCELICDENIKSPETSLTLGHVLGLNDSETLKVINSFPKISQNFESNEDNAVLTNLPTDVENDVVENSISNLFSDSGSLHQFDLLVCIKQLTLDNIEEILNILKVNTKTFAIFFEHSNLRPYYLGLYFIIRKLTIDMSSLIKDNSSVINKLLEFDMLSLMQDIIKEVTLVNIENRIFNLVAIFKNTDNGKKKPSLENCSDSNLRESLEKQIAELENKLERECEVRVEERNQDLEKYQELESNMELLKEEYYKCEEYWSMKVNEERELFDHEQQITDDKFSELLNKLSEYEKQFTSQDNKHDRYCGSLPTIEEKYSLEKQFTDLEEEFQDYKSNTDKEIQNKNAEIEKLLGKINVLEESKMNDENSAKTNICSMCIKNPHPISNIESQQIQQKLSYNVDKTDCISSPINYLWNQSVIPSPLLNIKSSTDTARDYQNPAFAKEQLAELNNSQQMNSISPIQKPSQKNNNVHQASFAKNIFDVKSEKKMLHCSELEESLQGRKREVQQFEASRTKFDTDGRIPNGHKPSPQNQMNSSVLKAVALEIHCRQLQAALRQQHSYTEAILQQTIAAHRGEIGALRQRLAAADILVRDLYVENCHLARSLTHSIAK